MDFAVSVEDLKLGTTPDGVRHGKIEAMLVAYDRDGKPLNLVAKKSKILLQPSAYTAVQKIGLQLHQEIDVPQGEVYLRTGIYDLGSGTAGTLGVPLSTVIAQKITK